MDSNRFDRLVVAFSRSEPRRAVVRLLGALPLLGGLAALLDEDEATARGRKRRNRQPQKHRQPAAEKKHKKKRKHKKKCKPHSLATTCAGTCGPVVNNCKKTVDCGSCTCDPPCPACQICQGGICVPCPNCCDSQGVCQPGTSNAACGGNGSCDVCTEQQECHNRQCVCAAACTGKICGPDGCGHQCAPGCPAHATCSGDGRSCTCDFATCNGSCCAANAICHASTGDCCLPDSKAETCRGKCGAVIDNCGVSVDCGSCACLPTCAVCHICDTTNGDCIPDPEMQGHSCGDGQVCQANGACACAGDSCGACRACGGNGMCAPCPNCCDGQGRCQEGTADSACGSSGTCIDCGTGRRCVSGRCVCDGTSCPDGCCDGQGQCLRPADQTVDVCGSGGVTCGTCAEGGTCHEATCAAGACGATPTPDNAPGAGCASPNVCCRGVCCTDPMICNAQGQCVCPHLCNGVCSQCCADSDCPYTQHCDDGRCAACRPTPLLCTRNEQCCDFYGSTQTRDFGGCAGPGIGPGSRNCCRANLMLCQTGSDCCSGVCANATPGNPGVCSCFETGHSCISDFQCCTHQCQGGLCTCIQPGGSCHDDLGGCCTGTACQNRGGGQFICG